MSQTNLIPAEPIERRILLVRGQKVMLDFDLAELYGVEARALNQAVKRNLERFPADFMFQLSAEEARMVMRPPVAPLSPAPTPPAAMSSRTSAGDGIGNSSQIVTSSSKHRGLVYRPYVFTEQGVAMLSGVLRSPRAVQANIAIMRAFVQLRQMLGTHADLARKLAALEKKYDAQFRVVFEAIRELMNEKKKPKREIGFHTLMPKPSKSGGANAKKI